jgi:hypothetical protein
MKIKPTISQWVDGVTKYLDWIQITGIGDNYIDSCNNSYELCETVIEMGENIVDGEVVPVEIVTYIPWIKGTITIDGEDYANWDNSNEQIIEIILAKLGLEKDLD